MADFECVIWKVEHGSAAFVKTPNNRTIMLDSGNSGDFSPAVYLKIVYSLDDKQNRLDKLIISHPDNDHISDLPNVYTLLNPRILHRNPSTPENLVYPSGKTNLQEPLKTFNIMVNKYTADLSPINKSEPISNWGNVFIKGFCNSPNQIQNSLSKNNLSLVSYVRYNDLEILFPGDLEPAGWDSLLAHSDLKNYIGSAKYRFLIAPHHGRKSGIRCNVNGEEKVYEKFLNMMKPHLVIMSDVWGSEHTDPDAYMQYIGGFSVFNSDSKTHENKKILTTKTNKYVLLTWSEISQTAYVII